MVEITAAEQNLEKKKKEWEMDENRLKDIWDNIKHTNIHIKGSHKEKRKIKDLIKYLKK